MGDAGTGPPAGALRSMPRSGDARVQSLREAIEDGWVDVADELWTEVQTLPDLGIERPLLQARLAFLHGDPLAASQAIEEARVVDPHDPRVWATAAELAAMGQRFETALAELREGKERFGETPEILRAEGICAIFQPGLRQGKRGVELLESAIALDPDLPFIRPSLSEAHRLYAQELSATQTESAIAEAEKAVAYSQDNLEARELLGDLYMVANRWGEGIELFEGLLADGRPIEAKVAVFSKQAGVVALTQEKRELAVRYFLRARELGLSNEELGTGVMVLQREATQAAARASEAMVREDWETARTELDAADRLWPDAEETHGLRSDLCVREGLVSYQNEQVEEARERFEQALKFDPDSLMARNLLGKAEMELGHYAEASNAWHQVVDEARRLHVTLPDPVHLALASALALQDKLGEARGVLQNYLDLEPGGEFVEATRQMLLQMDGQ